MSTSDGTDLSKGVLPAEIWNPDTETWTTVASLTNPREYHSTALLLPDGRVLMAGGGALPGRRHRPEERRDLLAAVPVQGRAADDQLAARRRELRLELRHHDAGRRVDHEGLAHPLAVGDARVRPEPALPVPELHARVGQDHGSGAGDREPGAAWRLPAVHPQRERRAVRGQVHPDLVDWRRHTADARRRTSPPTPTSGQVALTLGRVDGPERHRELQRLPLDHPGLHAQHRATGSPSRRGRATPTSAVRPGTYYYKVTADDNAGQHERFVERGRPPSCRPGPLPGLVAAYGFDEGSGTTDGRPAPATATPARSRNATWSTRGKFGKALSFNGTNAWVTVASSNSLDLTTGMTAEAWVNPTTLGNAYRTRRLQGAARQRGLRRSTPTSPGRPQAPVGEVHVGGYKDAVGDGGAHRPARWTHLAETYDGSSVRLYVNGTLVSTTAARRLARQLDGAAADRRQHHLGRVLQRPDRRGAGLQPRAERGRDPAGHDARSITPDRHASRRARPAT